MGIIRTHLYPITGNYPLEINQFIAYYYDKHVFP